MPALDSKALMAAIDAAKDNCYGPDDGSTLSQRRAKAIEAYLGLNTNPAPEGRSQVVDRSVYETISTLLPSLVRIFVSSNEDICKFLPVGPEDEGAADQTTALMNHVVTSQNQWEQICADWLHDSLLLGNGYCFPYWDESTERIREEYEGQSEDQLTLLMQDDDVTILEQTARTDAQMTKDAMEQWQMAAQQAQQAGQPAPPKPKPQTVYDLTIERSKNKGQVCIRTIPPEHCYVSLDTPDWTLQDCPYFEFRQEMTIAQLRDMGLEVDDNISDDAEDDDESDEDYARDRFGESNTEGDEGGGQGASRRVWARMIWVQASLEDDNISRLYYVVAVGRTPLFYEPATRVGVASMTPQPMPHRHPGMSVAETVVDIQDTKTAVKRGGLDNLYLATNGRHAISSRVNLDDMLDSRPGGVIRMLDDSALPGEGHIVPFQHPFAFGEIIQSLEFFDQERQNRTGASRYFSGTDAGAINKTAAGTIALQNMASMRVEHIARMMAPAVEHLFSLVHELFSKHSNKPLTLKLRGNWTTVDPQAWRTKRDVRISVGVGAGNKESMMQQLGNIFGAQLQLMPMGLAGPQQLFATVTEMAKLAGFANPTKFWNDPSQMPQQPPQPSPEQIKVQGAMQLEQFKAQNDAQKFQAEQAIEQQRMQMQAQVDQQREEWQARQKMLEAQQKAQLEEMKAGYDAQLKAAQLQLEEWKAKLDAAVKLEIAGMGAQQAQMQAEAGAQAKEQGGAQMENIGKMLTEIMEAINSPAEIIRNPQTGRAEGIKRGNTVRKINRGPDGRAIGVQ